MLPMVFWVPKQEYSTALKDRGVKEGRASELSPDERAASEEAHGELEKSRREVAASRVRRDESRAVFQRIREERERNHFAALMEDAFRGR